MPFNKYLFSQEELLKMHNQAIATGTKVTRIKFNPAIIIVMVLFIFVVGIIYQGHAKNVRANKTPIRIDCSAFTYQEDAQTEWDQAKANYKAALPGSIATWKAIKGLDGNNDGKVCQKLPRRTVVNPTFIEP